LAGCGIREAELAQQARDGLVGLSPSDIRMCAGLAAKTEKDKSGDIWMYEHGTTVPGGFPSPTVSVPLVGGVQANPSSGYCRVQFRFVKDRLAAVEYAGETDIMGNRDAACAQMVKTCLQRYAHRN
jgi:hypothetical protein